MALLKSRAVFSDSLLDIFRDFLIPAPRSTWPAPSPQGISGSWIDPQIAQKAILFTLIYNLLTASTFVFFVRPNSYKQRL